MRFPAVLPATILLFWSILAPKASCWFLDKRQQGASSCAQHASFVTQLGYGSAHKEAALTLH